MHTVNVNLIANQEITITTLDGKQHEVNVHDLSSIIVDADGRIIDYSPKTHLPPPQED